MTIQRSTDLCTCGKPRDAHGDFFDATQHTFFPNPQPNSGPKIPFGRKLNEFLAAHGEVSYRGDSTFVKELDGTVWEVSAFLRKDPAASP